MAGPRKIQCVTVYVPGQLEPIHIDGDDVTAFAAMYVPETEIAVIRVALKDDVIRDFYGCAVEVIHKGSAIVPAVILPGGRS
jgi:hypothetical protein